MALFPKIDSPCPYKDKLAEIMDGDVCRKCDRQVHDLNAMSDEGRVAFLKSCKTEVCVSYSMPRKLAAAALAAAAIVAPMAAAAEEMPDYGVEIIVGGIEDPAHTEMVSDADNSAPELPVVYEEQSGAAPTQPASAEAQPAANTPSSAS